ncbi:MAG: hypothetical protein JO247_23685 [Chloroflexi bacterium]|nr:hypothetical protein [Chloroflexota bacterium]
MSRHSTARVRALAAGLLLAGQAALGAPSAFAQATSTPTFPAVPTDLPTQTPAPTDTAVPTIPVATDAPTDTPVPANTAAPTDTPPPPVDATATATGVAVATTITGAPTQAPTTPPSSGGGGSPPAPPAPPASPPPPPGPVNAVLSATGGSTTATLPGGQTLTISVGANVLGDLRTVLPNVANVTVIFNPAPSLPNAAAAGSLGGGAVTPLSAPVDIKIVPQDANGNALQASALPSGSTSTVDLALPVLNVTISANGVFAWLQATYVNGAFFGYIRPPADFNPTTGNVTVHASLSSLQGTLFLPAVIVPAWVQNFDPNAHIFSGPDQAAQDFGAAGPAYTTFTVVAPQVGTRLYVYNPVSSNYGWIDVSGVGPSGPPS